MRSGHSGTKGVHPALLEAWSGEREAARAARNRGDVPGEWRHHTAGLAEVTEHKQSGMMSSFNVAARAADVS